MTVIKEKLIPTPGSITPILGKSSKRNRDENEENVGKVKKRRISWQDEVLSEEKQKVRSTNQESIFNFKFKFPRRI